MPVEILGLGRGRNNIKVQLPLFNFQMILFAWWNWKQILFCELFQVRCWEVMGSGTNVGAVPKASISHEQPVIYKHFAGKFTLFFFMTWIYQLCTIYFWQVLCSTWKDDGTTVFSGGCDKQVKMWPLSGSQPVTVGMHDAPVKELAWIPEMSLLVTGSWDKTLR